jgi:hypothetical protein
MPALSTIIPIIAALSFFGLAVCHAYEAIEQLHKGSNSVKVEEVATASSQLPTEMKSKAP